MISQLFCNLFKVQNAVGIVLIEILTKTPIFLALIQFFFILSVDAKVKLNMCELQYLLENSILPKKKKKKKIRFTTTTQSHSL